MEVVVLVAFCFVAVPDGERCIEADPFTPEWANTIAECEAGLPTFNGVFWGLVASRGAVLTQYEAICDERPVPLKRPGAKKSKAGAPT